MKHRIIICATIILLLFLTGCKREFEFDTEDLSENAELQSKLYNAIIANDELLNNFMLEMAQRPEAMQQMMMNQSLMQQMFSEENMEMLQESEPITMQMMMKNMRQATGEGMMNN